jgi:hypothetical protein
MKKALLFWVIMLVVSTQSKGQGFELWLDNDALYYPASTDRFYSNGLELTYFSKVSTTSSGLKQWSFALRHRIYNGLSNASPEVLDLDRPYVGYGWLSASRDRYNLDNQTIFRAKAALGWMGSGAGGAYVQNQFHALLENSGEVYGWDRQLQDMPIIQMEASHSWFAESNYIAIGADAGAALGSLTTNAFVGGQIYTGLLDQPFSLRSNKVSFIQLHGTVKAVAVGYDATLQGSPFLEDPNALSVNQIAHGRVETGLFLESQWKGLHISTGFQWMSPEIKGLPGHRFGTIRVGYFF